MAGAAIIVSLQQLKSLLGITNFTKQMGLVPVLSSVFRNRKEVLLVSQKKKKKKKKEVLLSYQSILIN